MYFVYVLRRMKKGNLYVGYTKNLKKRVTEHKRKAKEGLQLVYYEAYAEERLARTREKRLKAHGSAWTWLKKRLELGLRRNASGSAGGKDEV